MHAFRLSQLGNASEGRRFRLLLVAALAAVAGCTPLATVPTLEPKLGTWHGTAPERRASEENIVQAKRVEHADPNRAIGFYLAAVESAAGELRRNPEQGL